jgi:hypothetical protein
MPGYEQRAASSRGRSEWADEQEREVRTRLHLFKEYEGGDIYAARDITHAKELWHADTGENPDENTDWGAIPDDKSLTLDEDGAKVTKAAGKWAAEMASPGLFGGENY